MSSFNLDLPQYSMFAAALIFVIGLIFLLTWILRRFSGIGGGQTPFSRRDRRLKVIEGATIGSRHRLILVQRDHVEHLLLIGGTTDLVVERNITLTSQSAPPSGAAPYPPGSSHIEPRFNPRSQSPSDDDGNSDSDAEPGAGLQASPRPGEA